MEAMARIQVDQVNDHLEIILQLQNENELLRSSIAEADLPSINPQQRQKIALLHQQLPFSGENRSNETFSSSTSQLCNTAQVKESK
jgi:hypothetical protein